MAAPTVPYPKAIREFPTIRQSLAGQFDNCSLQTWFDTQHRQGWSHPYQARGEIFHRTAARCLATMAQYGENQIPVGEALEVLHEVLSQREVDRVCPVCGSTKIRRGITRRGMRSCLSCRQPFETNVIRVPMTHVRDLYWVVKKWAHETSYDVANLVDVEKQLRASVYYDNPVIGGSVERTVTGTADALFVEGADDDHAIVLDWKDMWKLPPPTEIGHAGYFQQRFYAYLIFANYPSIERITLREFYVRYSEPREATLTREVVEQEVGRELGGLIEQFDRTVEEKLWNPTPGAHCTYCPMPEQCPIHPEARGAGRIGSHEEAARVAREFVVASAIVKQTREQLSAWAEMHGPIPLKDAKGARVLGLQESSSTAKPDADAIERLARDLGRAPTMKEIKGLYKTRTTTRLGQYVPMPDVATDADEDFIAALKASVEQVAAVVGS